MTDYEKAIADARDALAKYQARETRHYIDEALRDLLDAIDAPAAAVPEGGLRDSVLNSAKFRASCYALVGIVEGIEGLGRNWAANGERLKDTREWVAFYNCVASMRNGTFNQASAEQAQQPAAAVSDGGFAIVPADALREVIRISDRSHPAWDAVKAAMLAATPAQQPAAAVPDGYALVPVEPTRGMIEAGIMFGNSPNKAAIIWQNMLAAARKGGES